MITANPIRKIRQRLLMHQREFAQILGVSTQAVCNYENGVRFPKMHTISKMRDLAESKGIDFDIDEFFKGQNEH